MLKAETSCVADQSDGNACAKIELFAIMNRKPRSPSVMFCRMRPSLSAVGLTQAITVAGPVKKAKAGEARIGGGAGGGQKKMTAGPVFLKKKMEKLQGRPTRPRPPVDNATAQAISPRSLNGESS